jgi:hypothetical protein
MIQLVLWVVVALFPISSAAFFLSRSKCLGRRRSPVQIWMPRPIESSTYGYFTVTIRLPRLSDPVRQFVNALV